MSDIQDMMKFEFLPNEILIQCFEYLNAFDIFHSFDQLNSRFNKIIHHIPLHLNYKYVNKSIFDQFCTKMLRNPEVKNQIYSLKLSDKQTCDKIKTFSTLFSLNEFSNLRYLTVIEVNRDNIEKLESMLPLIPQLCYLHWTEPYSYSIIKSLSNLQTLSLPSIRPLGSIISETSSIINLTILRYSILDLYYLLKHIPMLKYLNIQNLEPSCVKFNEKHFIDLHALQLKQMIIGEFKSKWILFGSCNGNEDQLDNELKTFEKFIKQIPNLKKLTISALDTSDNLVIINATRWEDLIRSSLHYLETFKFKFSCQLYGYKVNVITDRFKQFQTDFWQKQHHWYTGYVIDNQLGLIYTIPYLSNEFKLTPNNIRHSHNVNIFHNVTDLTLNQDKLTENCQYYFSNITSLILTGEELTKNSFEYLKMIVNLLHLKHLTLSWSCQIESSSILLELLKQAPQLVSLSTSLYSFRSFFDDNELCKYLNKMIKQLNLQSNSDGIFDNYSSFQATKFCEIFNNIEHLQCEFDLHNNILFLLDHLPKLSTMKVTWKDVFNADRDFSKFENILQKRNVIFHTKQTCRTTTDEDEFEYDYNEKQISIWIGKNIT